MIGILVKFGVAVVLTILIESLIIIPAFYKYSVSKRQLILNVILINAITNITLNSVLYMSGSLWWYSVIAGELVIPAIEGLMYKAGALRLGTKRVIGICYIANIVSFFMGILLEGIL